jgi:hypothetical protein
MYVHTISIYAQREKEIVEQVKKQTVGGNF